VDDRPVTRYATAPDGVSIAYQVTGDGPTDLIWLPALVTPIDLLWDEPGFVRFAKRLGGFTRTVFCEPRGIGASGGDPRDGFVEEIADGDVTAVLDAVGSQRVVLVGANHGGATAIRYAVAHRERVSAVILVDTYAHHAWKDDYPWGITDEVLERLFTFARDIWGSGATIEMVAPSKVGDAEFCAWYARSERLGVGPETVMSWFEAAVTRDTRELLPTLQVPTLVLHREGDRYVNVGEGRYLAEHIPGAKSVELPGEDYLFFVGDTDALLDEVEEFLTGSHQSPEGDLVTTTILFTDIVASTEQSARLGHRKWTALTDAHDAMVRASLARHRGREIKTTGDGFLASFDASSRAVRAACEIVEGARGLGVDVRAGVHTGEVEVRPDDVVGLAVSIAKRICDLAGPGQVLVSETVKSLLVGSSVPLSEEGTHVLKGVPDQWKLFAVEF